MKNKLKNYLKLGIFLFGITFVLINCERDYIEEVQENSTIAEDVFVENGIQIRTITLNQLQEKQELQKTIEKLSKSFDINKSKSSTTSKVDANDGSFTILTDEIMEVTTDSTEAYTFRIEIPTDSTSTFENFVIDKSNDSLVKFYIYKYLYDETQEDDFPYITSFTEVDEDIVDVTSFDGLLSKVDYGPNCIVSTSCLVPCWVGYCHTADMCDGSGAIFVNQVDCTEDAGGGDGNEPDGGGGVPADPTDPTDPDPSATGVLPEVEDNPNPCVSLNNLIDPTKANIKPDLEYLKTIVDESQENGVSFKKSGETYNSVNLSPGLSLHMTLPIGGDVYSGAHTHTDDSFPMFDWGDLFALFNMHNQANINVKDEVTLFLVSQDFLSPTIDVYAVVINDINAFALKLQQDINSLRLIDPTAFFAADIRYKINALNEKYGMEFDNSDDYERTFLESFRNHNISLYKANEDISNWSKLTIPESVVDMSVNEEPCIN